MEKIKLENFNNEYGFAMPIEKHLSQHDCSAILLHIYNKFHIHNIEELFSILECKSINIDTINAKDDNVNIEEVFSNVDIAVLPNIYINWGDFDNIDCLKYNTFCNYFDDIWYPAIDDIEIFDETCDWFLSIKHYGLISYWKSK